MLLRLLCLLCFAFPALAEMTVITRANDPGVMTKNVDPADVQCDTLVTFDDLTAWQTSDQGAEWGVAFVDQEYQRIDYPEELPRNPCQWPQSPACPESGVKPNGRLVGAPSVPYEIADVPNIVVHNYKVQGGNRWSQTTNLSASGCGEQACGDWGDDPWVMHHETPFTGMCVTVRFANCALYRHQHMLFYRDDEDGDGKADLAGHFDAVGEITDGTCPDLDELLPNYPGEFTSSPLLSGVQQFIGAGAFRTFCFTSEVPVQAAVFWMENGSGTVFDEICLEHGA